MVEIKSLLNVDKNMEAEYDGFEIHFTPEEKAKLEIRAVKECKPIETIIGEAVAKAMEGATEEILKKVAEHKRKNAK